MLRSFVSALGPCFLAGLCFLCGLSLTSPATAASLDAIKSRGKVVVGVKPDYRPWGFLDADGKIIGMEADLAKDLAERLGVEVQIVPARSADRLDLLRSGRIDVLIATMSDTPERRQVAGLLLPHYYSSGTNILSHKRYGFKKWADVKGRKVCGREGAFYNRPVAVRYGADVVVFKNNQEAKKALRDGRCHAWLSDDTTIVAELRDKNIWEDYEMPLPTEDITPWSIGVPLEEQDGPLADFIARTIGDWHRSGKLIELEQEWAARPSEFLQRMNATWNRKTNGDWHCSFDSGRPLPPDCNSVVTQ